MKRMILLVASFMNIIHAQDTTISIASFVNNTDQSYILYQRPRPIETESGPVFAARSSDWVATMILRPKEKGTMDVLIKDPEMYGLEIKLAPENGVGKSFYLKGGIRESGDCVQNWYEGPYGIIAADSEEAINYPIKHFKKISHFRVCSYRDTLINIAIFSDDIQIINEHNARILGDEKMKVGE